MMSNMAERTNEPQDANEQVVREQANEPKTVSDLNAQLAEQRALQTVRDQHTIAVRSARAAKRTALANVAERTANDSRSRRSRRRDARSGTSVENLYRTAAERGTNAFVRSQISQSAEMRSLRVAAVRRTALIVGIPVMLAFAAWSTSNVQAGVTRIVADSTSRATTLASWLVEPAIICIVALIIIGQAILRSSGGEGNKYGEAEIIKAGALATSLSLAIIGGWPTNSGLAGWITALPHGVGPIGCAVTAYLISLFDRYVADARPWEGAPKLADLNIIVASNIANTLATNEQAAALVANEQAAATLAANERVANGETSSPDTQTVIMPTEIMPVRSVRTGERTERTGERTSSRTARTASMIDEQAIRMIEERWPGWRTELPPARDLAEMLGYRSPSTGLKIRQQLITIVEQADEE